MPKGRIWPAEWSEYADRTTGFVVRQLTNSPPARNIHFYFHDPAWTNDGRWFVFHSARDERGAFFALNWETGQIVQLTERGGTRGWVSQLRPELFYWAGQEIRAVNMETLEERTVSTLPEGMSGSGGPSENADGSLLIFAGTIDGRGGIFSVREDDGTVAPIWVGEGRYGHVICSPSDPTLVMHCDSTVPDGKPKQRVWIISTDGTRHWHPYTQTAQEWLTHESWLGKTGAVLVCYWPTGIMRLNVDGSDPRLISAINAWHAAASPDGRYCVVDTNWPDRGIHLIETATGRMCKLCESDSGNVRTNVHPHPSFTPDGRYVVFGSDRTGNPEIYAVEIAQALGRPERWWTQEYRWPRLFGG